MSDHKESHSCFNILMVASMGWTDLKLRYPGQDDRGLQFQYVWALCQQEINCAPGLYTKYTLQLSRLDWRACDLQGMKGLQLA